MLVLSFCGTVPTMVFGAEVSFELRSNLDPLDTSTVVDVVLLREGAFLNALEGTIRIEGDTHLISSVMMETGDAAVSLWVTDPVYDPDTHTIRFAGGTTKYFSDTSKIFRIRIFMKEDGIVRLVWLNGSAYHSDGVGTEEMVNARSMTVSAPQYIGSTMNAMSHDTTPPVIETLLVSSDPDVEGGQWFVSVHAVDGGSGIAYYEIVESQEKTMVKPGDIYVLKDQTRSQKVVVIAYDRAGNSSSVRVPLEGSWILTSILVLVVCGVVGIGYVFVRRRKQM